MAQTGAAVRLGSSPSLQASTMEGYKQASLRRDVAGLSSSLLLSRRSPLGLEKGPKLSTGVTASGVVALSITWSLIFVSDACVCG